MPSTSGTYNFQFPSSVELITDAYERIGIVPDLQTGNQIFSAQRALNFVLQSWINRGFNLWSMQQGMIGLVANQGAYVLPPYTSDLLEVAIRQSQITTFNGVAASSLPLLLGQDINNAFPGNGVWGGVPSTQNGPSGNISYTFNNNNVSMVTLFGVQSNVTRSYTLAFEYSNDGGTTWIDLVTPAMIEYPAGIPVWATITAPVSANAYRIRETGTAVLDIQILLFNNTINDTYTTRVSRREWVSYPAKNQAGKPNSFWVDRQSGQTVVTLWPVPDNTGQYNNLFFTRVVMPQDIGAMIDNAQIPSRFLEALTAGAAYQLALKNPKIVTPDKRQELKLYYEEVFGHASKQDVEDVPLRIYGDYNQGGGGVMV